MTLSKIVGMNHVVVHTWVYVEGKGITNYRKVMMTLLDAWRVMDSRQNEGVMIVTHDGMKVFPHDLGKKLWSYATLHVSDGYTRTDMW